MPPSAEFRELLFADVALLKHFAEARQVAAALLRYWDRRQRAQTSLAQELARLAGLTEAQLAEIGAEVERLVGAAGGDPRLAVTRRGGLAHDLHAAVSRQDPSASRQLTELGAGIRVALRSLPKDRYLDFLPVGEGGMGIVYWAMDTELGRQVAFKVVRPPAPAGAGVTPPAPLRMRAPSGDPEAQEAFEELKARFLQEAWVTGGMEHPGIVPVYELGRTEGGVPYYTMRFVRGRRTLETAIEELAGRPFEERLALLEPFLKVCDAISYAHSRGVVHRDLKPANVALGEYGEAIVLDWGLAKLSGHPDVHASRWQANVTEFRTTTDMATLTSAIGTPGYMAPEAASGDVEAVDELSDVYSLGAILYEIVTGRRAVLFESFQEYAERVIGTDAPDARELDPGVAPGLAALCASAIARDRARRPAGAAALAQALRTWQKQQALDREIEVLLAEAQGALTETEGMSVSSMRKQAERATAACQRVLDQRPGETRARGLLERARALRDQSVRVQEAQARRSLVRRIALLSLLAVAVLGAIVAYVLEQRRQEAETAKEVARVERDRAATNRTQAERAIEFITRDLREALEPEGRLDLLAKIGEQAREHYAQIPVAGESPESFRRRIRALRQLGEVYFGRGDLSRARAVFGEAAAASDAYRAGGEHAALALFENSRAHVDIARVDQAQGYAGRGSDRVAQVVERLGGARPPRIPRRDWDELRVRALNALARGRVAISEYAAAHEAAQEALRIAKALARGEGADPALRRLLVETTLLAAGARFHVESDGSARRLAQDAVADARLLLGARPDDLTLEALLVQAVTRLAFILRYESAFAQAERVLSEILPTARRLAEARPDNGRWQGRLLSVLWLRGDARAANGPAGPKALADYEDAFAIAQRLHAKDRSHVGWVSGLITLCDRLAQAVAPQGQGDRERARLHRKQAVAFARRLTALEPENPRFRYQLGFTLGVLADLTKDRERALALAREGRAHTRYALERIPTAQDINIFWGLVSWAEAARLPDARARLLLAREAFDVQLEVVRGAPDAYWANRQLAVLVGLTRSRLRVEGAAAEVRREADLALAWYKRQAARGEALPGEIRADLEAWVEAAEAAKRAVGK